MYTNEHKTNIKMNCILKLIRMKNYSNLKINTYFPALVALPSLVGPFSFALRLLLAGGGPSTSSMNLFAEIL